MKFARFLPEHGWDVTVLTVRRRTGPIDPLLRPPPDVVATGELPVAALLKIADAIDRSLARVARRLRPPPEPAVIDPRYAVREGEIPASRPGWVLPAVVAGARLARRRRFDVVLASLPPPMVGMAGWAIARLTRTPLVIDYRDPWSVDPIWMYDDVGRPRRDLGARVRLAAARRVERRLLRDAAGALVVNGAAHVDHLARVFPSEAGALPVRHVPNAVDVEDVHRAAAYGPRPPDGDDRIVVTFNGHFYGAHTPYFLLRGLRALARLGPELLAAVRFDFVGTGFPAALRDALGPWGLDAAVNVVPAEPYSASLARLHRADALLLVLPPFSSYVDCIPTKLWEYVAVGKPVLAVAPKGAVTQLLAENGVPTAHAEPGDDQAIAAAVADLVALVRSGARRAGPVDQHDYRERTATLDRALREMIGRTR